MQHRAFILTSIIFIYSGLVIAQDSLGMHQVVDSSLVKLELELTKLGEVIRQDSLLLNRQNANYKFAELFEQALENKHAFNHPFDSLTTVSQLESRQDSIRIFTWQLFEQDDIYTYMGYILKADGSVTRLTDTSIDYLTPEFETGDKDHWYGALYYNMVPFYSENNQRQFLMFGYDGNSLMERRKVIDVMYFDENGLPQFGAPVFIAGAESKAHPPVMQRFIIEYFAGANVNCNYDEFQNQILYEHLIFTKTPYGEFLIPDGSYEGYIFEEGKWKHNVKVFHQVQDVPPGEGITNKEEQKDLFGEKYKRATVNPNRSKENYEEVRKRNKKLRAEKKKS